MSNFIKQGSRKARLNKEKVSKQVEEALAHDGDNWSLLAVGRDAGIEDGELFTIFGELVAKEFVEENGYTAGSFNGHTVFTKIVKDKDNPRLKDEVLYYIKPVGHPDGEGGYEVWDMHINNNMKELYLNYLKTIKNG